MRKKETYAVETKFLQMASYSFGNISSKTMTTDTVEFPYPKVLASHGLVESYKEFSPTHLVPEKTKNNEVKAMLKMVTSKPGFDPNLKFDPKKHIIFKPSDYKKTKVFTLSDLKIEKTHIPRVTDFGAAFPFPLLSQEAVDMLIYEAFQPHIIEKYARSPNLATKATRLDFHIGGFAETEGPFTKALVRSEELAEIVSTFFGAKLEPIFNYGTCHWNVSLATLDEEEAKTYANTHSESEKLLAEQDAGDGDSIPSTLGLHYDSTTVALVIMIDLPEDAIGGQTTIITGDEKIVRVPDPKVGHATLIQGRILKHLASKPVTNHNRITFVNGYAAAGAHTLDNTAITSTKPSVLPKSRFDLFYRDWVDYKFRRLEDHLEYIRKGVVKDYESGKGFDQEGFVERCQIIEDYFHQIWNQMECVNNPPFPPAYFKTPYKDLS